MNDLEAARLAKMMRDKPSNINVPSDPTFALAMMEHALRATEKPAESDPGVSGYHPVSVQPLDLQRKRDDYADEQQQIEDVVWFFEAGNSIEDAKQEPLAREEFSGSDEEYEEHCEACAI